MNINNIKAFIFDLDDTIVQSERLNIRLIGDYFQKVHNIELDDSDKNLVFGHSWQDIFRKIIERYNIQDLSIYDVQDAVLINKREYLYHNKIRVANGVQLVLEMSQRMVIVSGSGKEEIVWLLKNAEVEQYFEMSFSIDDYAHGKPAPDGFLMALDYLGLESSQCLVFEDSLSGIEAAKAANIKSVFIGEFADKDCGDMADISFGTFAEFYQYTKS